MTLFIDSIAVEILHSDTPISSGQTDVLDALQKLVGDGCFMVTLHSLTKQFGLQSSAPMISRINHLIQYGWLRLV